MPFLGGRWRLAVGLTVGVALVIVVTVAISAGRRGTSIAPRPPSASGELQQGTALLTPPFPSPRAHPAMAYDAFRHEVVLFGGLDGRDVITTLTDTWTFQGRRWTKREPVTRPGPMLGAQMAYDAVTHDCLLVWSGNNGSLAVTWVWDGTTWSRLPNVPIASDEGFQALASDPTTGHVLVISVIGIALSSAPLQTHTWSWDGRAWTLRHPRQPFPVTNGPPSLVSLGQSTQGRLGRGILAVFTAGDGTTQTWLWDGSTWSRRAAGATPPYDPLTVSMAEDATAEDVVLVGLGDPVNGGDGPTWVWDGATWHEAGAAPLVVSPEALSDSGSAHAIILGDRSPDNQSNKFDELWTFDGLGWISSRPA